LTQHNLNTTMKENDTTIDNHSSPFNHAKRVRPVTKLREAPR
jgi:hypothetical protein